MDFVIDLIADIVNSAICLKFIQFQKSKTLYTNNVNHGIINIDKDASCNVPVLHLPGEAEIPMGKCLYNCMYAASSLMNQPTDIINSINTTST